MVAMQSPLENQDRMSEQQLAVMHKLMTDYKFFAANCLWIEDKYGNLERFIFNSAQNHLHNAIEKQLREKGFVRMIIVKGRQQGISTYIEGRIVWKMVFKPYIKALIMSHEAKSTQTLYEKILTFWKNLPPGLFMEALKANEQQLKLTNESRVVLFTAGSSNTGRGQTGQIRHDSERAFFENSEEIDSGVGQAVADLEGTEAYKESTGNGKNDFEKEAMEAEAGKGKYRLTFIPYFWQPEYRAKPEPGFRRTQEEQELIQMYGSPTHCDICNETHPGLNSDEQLEWRRDKISEFGKGNFEKGLRKFRQEYPNTLTEAFQSVEGSYHDPQLVIKARKSKIKATTGPLIIGVDPGRAGDDTAIFIRKGREGRKLIVYEGMDQMRLAGIIAALIDELDPDRVFLDAGMGHGTYDRLVELGYGSVVELVNFGEKADSEEYLNKRAEMACRFDEWLRDPGGCSLPDDEVMQGDIGAMPQFTLTSNGKIKFPPKDEIKKKIGRSPDRYDAIILTFARNVRSKEFSNVNGYQQNRSKKGSPITTMNRFRNKNMEETRDPSVFDGQMKQQIKRNKWSDR